MTYYAQLYDDVPDDDLKEHERERPLIWIGETSCSFETVEQLQRQMGIDLRPDVASALWEERDLHLAGELDESLERCTSAGSCFGEMSFANTLGVFRL